MAPRRKSIPPPDPAQARPAAVSWYPPHMHRAHRRLGEELASIDVVLEMRDARLPLGSGNPDLERLIRGRKRLLLFNKSALASPAATRRWKAWFETRGEAALFLDADAGRGVNLIYPLINGLGRDGMETLRRRGIRPPPQRLMVVGIPNVGKSTLINRMAGKKRLAAAPHPGVTKGMAWVNLKGRYELMDTPGLILPRLEKNEQTLKLGWIGAFRDTVLGEPTLAAALLPFLAAQPGGALRERYGLEATAETGEGMIEQVARARGMTGPGGLPDLAQAARAVLGDFRAGRLGRVTLEEPAEA